MAVEIGGEIIKKRFENIAKYKIWKEYYGLPDFTKGKKKVMIEKKKHIKEAQGNRIEKANKILSEKLTKTTITIEVQVGEEERIFGSVTSQDIQGSLEANGISIDRSAILMEEPIKSLGVYNIPVRITEDIEADLKVYVIKA